MSPGQGTHRTGRRSAVIPCGMDSARAEGRRSGAQVVAKMSSRQDIAAARLREPERPVRSPIVRCSSLSVRRDDTGDDQAMAASAGLSPLRMPSRSSGPFS
jgi:hypothetical protein